MVRKVGAALLAFGLAAGFVAPCVCAATDTVMAGHCEAPSGIQVIAACCCGAEDSAPFESLEGAPVASSMAVLQPALAPGSPALPYIQDTAPRAHISSIARANLFTILRV